MLRYSQKQEKQPQKNNHYHTTSIITQTKHHYLKNKVQVTRYIPDATRVRLAPAPVGQSISQIILSRSTDWTELV